METTEQATTAMSPEKQRHLDGCMKRLERKLSKTRFSEAEKQVIRDREATNWHNFNDDVPDSYYR